MNENNEQNIVIADSTLTTQVTEKEIKTELYKTRKIMRQFGDEGTINPADIGRPTVMTPDTLELLAEAWLMGCNDEEASTYAGIHPATLYLFQKDKPEFIEHKEHLKRNPILKARITLYKALSDPTFAWKYLHKKTTDLQDDTGKTGNVTLNIQLNQLVEQDRKRVED